MRPARADFRAPHGGTLTLGVVLYGRDPRTQAVARLPLPGTSIEWAVTWPTEGETIETTGGKLLVDQRTGAIVYPLADDRIDVIANSAPIPFRVTLRAGSARFPFLVGTIGFGEPAPMINPPVLLETLMVPAVDVLPRIEPYLVGIMLPYPLGAADQAVAEAARAVEALLASPDLAGAPTAPTPDLEASGREIATAAFVQGVAELVVKQAADIAEQAIRDLITTPGRFKGLLPTSPPDQPDTPWLNTLDGGAGQLAFTPSDPAST